MVDSLDFVTRANSDYIETMYQQYQKDPRSLDEHWRAFFAGIELASDGPTGVLTGSNNRASTLPLDVVQQAEAENDETPSVAKGVYALVHMYRELGHFVANLDPLGHNRTSHPLLKLSEFGLSPDDLDLYVNTGGFIGETDGTLRDLLEKLQRTYCGTFAVQYTDIPDLVQRIWLEQRMEPIYNRPAFSAEECRAILNRLVEAEEFENFLQTRFLGKKRFSVEGGESMLPLLDTLIDVAGDKGADEIVMGMAHRGRLNVLTHTLGKPYEMVLSEFEESKFAKPTEGDGDVKYHQGYYSEKLTASKKRIRITLSPNPSHLELVNPVIEGIVRSKQQFRDDHDHAKVIPILIHGDAAFTGQGVVTETLNLSELSGYKTGGTIHVILNNQLGYTATPRQTRFTPYPSDVAKTIQAPVFHVNADDPQAVVHAARLAMAFRQQFKVDVIIHLLCYRRYGHNETDDPTYTQPVMYREIEKHPTVSKIYAERLVKEGKITPAELERMRDAVRKRLDAALQDAREARPLDHYSAFESRWKELEKPNGHNWFIDTPADRDLLLNVTRKATRVPPGFTIHPKLERLQKLRQKMVEGESPLDWGCAEMLAFGSLLMEGITIRISGQDSERGTFSHRHAVWYDYETGEPYIPLKHIDKEQCEFTVLNSMLSEMAVLGFEYGVSTADPYQLVIWEAQFGDFVNGAQAIIDEFLVSSESKWQLKSGLVLLLPHGYEGQGPDHSSARLERFLQLCAEDNIQVCYPTTPAQIFHLLRLQVKRPFRKPLVVMSPKSLLRHKNAVSPIEEFTRGGFQPILPDKEELDAGEVKRILFCTGKIFYDLWNEREEKNRNDVAIVRVEQLYPFAEQRIQDIIKQYPNVKQLFWVQEEPSNMGAWWFMRPRLRSLLPKGGKLRYVGRDAAASPAHGYLTIHQAEQKEIIESAFSA
ncbi:MAG: 2-oxoglutarate dehydrogenase E1 component [bacterium]|nr:2-oxoglutarate dehydrogenase E1 component [bacterium]